VKRTRSLGKLAGGQGWAWQVSEGRPDAGANPPTSGPPTARLRLEQRRGKPVTVAALEGLDLEAMRTLGKELKSHCGSGGTVKDGAVELQGDHREALRLWLPTRGLRVKG